MKEYEIELLAKTADGSVAVVDASHATAVAQINDRLHDLAENVAAVMIRPAACQLSDDARALLLDSALGFDRHAVVCPLAVSDYAEAEKSLVGIPEQSLLPVLPHDCVLIRRDVLERFGGLNEESDLAYALADLCLRLNDYGFSTIQNNRAWISQDFVRLFHVDALRLALKDRYPSFANPAILCENVWLQGFVDLQLSRARRKPRILFEYSDMMPWYCGTSEMQLAMLDHYYQHESDRFDLYIRANAEAAAFHRLRERYGNVYLLDEEMPLCDLGYVSAQPLTLDQQLFLDEHCLRVVYTMLDCILLRSAYLAEGDPTRSDVVRSGLRYADGIVSISDFSHDDYRDYFKADQLIASKPHLRVYLSSDSCGATQLEPGEHLPFDSYVLVAGNYLKHKSLEDVLAVVADTDRNFVFMGIDLPEGCTATNVACYRSSFVSDSFLDALYDHCDCVVFPSQYEGFGLPITIAWRHGKKALVCDNDLNRELHDHFADMQPNLSFFSSFDQIPGMLDSWVDVPFQGSFDTSWAQTTDQVSVFLDGVLGQPLDWALIEERKWHYRTLREVRQAGESAVGMRRLVSERYLDGHPGRKAAARGASRLVRSVKNIIPRKN